MQLFDQLFDLIHDKQNKLECDVEEEKELQPYILQRWLSMYSPLFANLINNSTNNLWTVMDDKQIWYKMVSAVLPKSPRKKIAYIKKNQEKKKAKAIDKEVIAILANNLEMSQREIELYINAAGINMKQLKKQMGIESNATADLR